jgi:hypothetical protein
VPTQQQESKAAAELTSRVLSDAQRSSNDVASLNAYLQAELEAARKGQQTALAAAGTAEQQALALEVRVPWDFPGWPAARCVRAPCWPRTCAKKPLQAKLSEAQRAHAAALQQQAAAHDAALRAAEAAHAAAASKVRAEAEAQLSGLTQQMEGLRADVKAQLAERGQQAAQHVKELQEG